MPARTSWATIWSLLLAAGASTALGAQQVDQTATTVQQIDGTLVDRLPVDRLRQVLFLLPGINATSDGNLSLRGGRPGDAATYLDAVSVSPGYRKTSFTEPPVGYPGTGQSFLEFGTNAVERLSAMTGPLSASMGNTQSGVIAIETRSGGERFDARASIESDAPFGDLHGPGLNRVQGLSGGRLGGRFRFMAAAVIEGRKSRERGPGAEDAPVFEQAGIDTTVGVPSAINDPFADTTFVDVSSFAPSEGIRLPSSASSSYQLAGRLEYQLGTGTELRLSGVASRDQLRLFDSQFLYLPSNLKARSGTSRVVTLGLRQELGVGGSPLVVRAALSLQRDQSMRGPLTVGSELDSRDGLFLSSLDFVYDFDSFPIDDELMGNIRNNIPGSRRSPLDLENTSQYSLINRYRNSPYGLDGGPEAGGPSGRLSLLREKRTTGSVSANWTPGALQSITAGLEFTRYSIAGYDHNLVSQAYSDAFLADPTRAAVFLQDEVQVSDFVIRAGVRYDRFRSDGERPFLLDTVASSPRFGTYSYFPSPNSYGSGGITFQGNPLVKFVEHEAHDVVSPRLQVAFSPMSRTTFRLGYARQAQMPDLSMVLSGMNIDFRVTNTSHAFGNDLDFERTTIYEAGVRHRAGQSLTLDGAVYSRELDDQALFALQTFRDPARLGENVDIVQATNFGLGKVQGIDTRIDVHGGMISTIAGYSYQKAEGETNIPPLPVVGNQDVTIAESRPHTLTAIVALEVPGDWRRGSPMGNILRDVGLYAGFRYSSGTAYTRCLAQDLLSGETCVGGFDGDVNGSRLPSFKQLDLRITKSVRIAGRELMAYLDGRNVLNFENIVSVFAATGKTSSPTEMAQVFSQDSASFANEAVANGILQNDGSITLTFGGAVASGCGNYVNSQFTPAAPSCVYLIRAEERFGNGDHVFTVAEQRLASGAAYNVSRSRSNFLGAPRRLRLGLEVRF